MVAPAIAGALLGGGFNLLGGLFGRKSQKKEIARAEYNNSPQGIRDRAEAAGFNPLVFAGPGTGTGYAPVMGNALSNALMSTGELLSGGIAQAESLKLQKSALEIEKQRLEKLVAKTTLRPNVPGLYGGSNVNSSKTTRRLSDPVGDGTALGGTQWIAPGRPVKNESYSSGPGLTEVQNKVTGKQGIVVPGADGEPWGIDELATAVVVGLPQMIYNFGGYISERRQEARFNKLTKTWHRAQTQQTPISDRKVKKRKFPTPTTEYGPTWGIPANQRKSAGGGARYRYQSN